MKSWIAMPLVILGLSFGAEAQEAPQFFKDTYPEHALNAMLQAEAALQGEGAALDAKTRELVSLGVAAQIPCPYCVYAHTASARAAGASEAEVREAIAAAAMTRHWSTVLNGAQYDLDAFKSEYDEIAGATN